MKIRRGDIVYLKRQFDIGGHVQNTSRPFLVVSNDLGNHYGKTCVLVPFTKKHRKLDFPTHLLTSFNNSVLLCENIFTIDQRDIAEVVNSLSDFEMEKVNKCLACELGIKETAVN